MRSIEESVSAFLYAIFSTKRGPTFQNIYNGCEEIQVSVDYSVKTTLQKLSHQWVSNHNLLVLAKCKQTHHKLLRNSDVGHSVLRCVVNDVKP